MANRTVTLAAGAMLALVSAAVAVCGAFLVVLLGPDGSLSTGHRQVVSAARALVIPVDDLDGVDSLSTLLGHPRLRMSLDGGGRPLFIGVGRTADVEAYLADANIDRITDLEIDPFRLEISHRPGSAPLAPPARSGVWIARSEGDIPSLDWRMVDGDYRIVLMNADASAGVAVSGRASVVVPHLYGFGIAMLVSGVVATLIGIMLIVIGARRPRHPPPIARQPIDSAVQVN